MKRENVLVPEDALARQRDFEAKIKEMFDAREAHPVACVDTFGCQQNVADGQKLMGMLADCGFAFTEDPKEADLVILNTCAVREHAEQRVFGNLGILTHTKKENPEQVICLCGCMAQEERVAQRVRRSPTAMWICVFGPHALWKFPELLWQVYETRKRVFAVDDEHGTIAEGIPTVREKGVQGLGQHHVRLQQLLLLLHRPLRPGPGAEPGARVRARRRCGNWWPPGTRTSPCWARTSTPTATIWGWTIDFADLLAGHRRDPRGVPASASCPATPRTPPRSLFDAMAAVPPHCKAAASALPVRQRPGAEGDEPPLYPRRSIWSWCDYAASRHARTSC